MAVIAEALGRRPSNRIPVTAGYSQQGVLAPPQGKFESYARSAYGGNEIVFSSIELLASSAGEPHITGRRWRRNSPTVRNQEATLASRGLGRREIKNWMVRNGYIEELPDHPLVQLLNNPNPFMSRGQMWGTIVMDRCLAGNAYLLKSRSEQFRSSFPLELWRLRPDRVRVIPSATDFIEAYEYRAGNEVVRIPARDIIHFKTRNPLDDYYGMPPLMAIAGRVDIDNYMRSFLRSFFERGGAGPGAILSVKQRLAQEQKDSIRDRFRGQFGAGGGFHELMVLDAAESTYTQMGLNRGLRDALPKELNAMQEARIAMVFGIPGSILGLLIGYESSSYANKRADWQVLWDITMAPLLSDLDDVLNLSLVPEFSGIDEVYFDLSDIRALQEDVDAIQERERKNFQAGGISLEEFRDAIGKDPDISTGTFYIPMNVQPKEREALTEEPEPPEPPSPAPTTMPMEEEEMAMNVIAEPRCPNCGRRNGANIQIGGSLTCARCRQDFVVIDTVNGSGA